MSYWPSRPARQVLGALQRIGWHVVKAEGSHKQLIREGARYTFAFHDSEEIGPKMMARIAKHTGLRREDL